MALTQLSSNIQIRDSENQNAARGKGAAPASRLTVRSALGTIGSNANIDSTHNRQCSDPQKKKEEENKTVSKSITATKPSNKDLIKSRSRHPSLSSYILQIPPRPSNVKNIDEEDIGNPQLVSEYINEIYVYMRRLEQEQCVRKDYMAGYQITSRMRSVLIDWLVQVHQRFHLLQETLFLTVAIIDRFLQDGEVSKGKLQLVGVTAMWIASKYEEMYAPEVADFVYITDNAYTKANIRQMECMMLERLGFNLGRPLPLHFLRRYSKAGEVDSTKHTLAKYLLELSIMDYQLVHVHPSEMAAAVLCLAMRVLTTPQEECHWDETLEYYSSYTEKQLQPTVERLAYNVQKSVSSKQQAVRQKYTSSKFMRISTIEELQSPVIEELAKNITLSS